MADRSDYIVDGADLSHSPYWQPGAPGYDGPTEYQSTWSKAGQMARDAGAAVSAVAQSAAAGAKKFIDTPAESPTIGSDPMMDAAGPAIADAVTGAGPAIGAAANQAAAAVAAQQSHGEASSDPVLAPPLAPETGPIPSFEPTASTKMASLPAAAAPPRQPPDKVPENWEPMAAPPSAGTFEPEASTQPYKPTESDDLFRKWLTVGSNSVDGIARENRLYDSIGQHIADVKAASGVDIQNPMLGGFYQEAVRNVNAKYASAADPLAAGGVGMPTLSGIGSAASRFGYGLIDPQGLATADQQIRAEQFRLYQQALEKVAETHPEDPAIQQAAQAALNMTDYADQFARTKQQQAQMAYAKANGTFLPWIASTLGEMAGSMRSELNVGGLMVNPGGPVASTAVLRTLEMGAKWAAVQMGLTALEEPGRDALRAQTGEEHGFWPVLKDEGYAALGGFIPGSIMHGIAEIGRLIADEGQQVTIDEFLRRAQENPPPGQKTRGQQWREEMEEWIRRQEAGDSVWNEATGQWEPKQTTGLPALPAPGKEGPAAARPPEPPPSYPTPPAGLRQTSITPHAIEEGEINAASVPDPLPGHMPGDVLATHQGLIQHAEFPDHVAPPLLPVHTPDAAPSPVKPDTEAQEPVGPARVIEFEGKPVTKDVAFDPLKLQTDAATFQYKGNGDPNGVTKRLQGVEEWNPLAEGKIVVYETRDGTQYVADGHQRTGLARSLDSKGNLSPGTTLIGTLFKEADGWTPADVRAYAAKKNLGEGGVGGSVIDTARVLRDRPDLWDKSLPTNEPMMRQAKGLSELSDEGWRMVLNGQVKPNHAAIVGLGVPDKTMHAAVLNDMVKFKPTDENAARMIVADANAAGFHHEQTSDLFGATEVARSLAGERSEVFSQVMKLLNDNRRIFAMLDREQDRIESAGNVLAGSNAEIADRAGRLGLILEKLATRHGPVSAALNKAATLVAEGMKAPAAARLFLEDLERLIKEEGLKLDDMPAPPAPRTDIDTGTPAGKAQQAAEIEAAEARRLAKEGAERNAAEEAAKRAGGIDELQRAMNREDYEFEISPQYYTDAPPRAAYAEAMSAVPASVRDLYFAHGIDATRGVLTRAQTLDEMLADKANLRVNSGPVLPTSEESSTGSASTRTEAPYILLFQRDQPQSAGPRFVVVNTRRPEIAEMARKLFPGEQVGTPQEVVALMQGQAVAPSTPHPAAEAAHALVGQVTGALDASGTPADQIASGLIKAVEPVIDDLFPAQAAAPAAPASVAPELPRVSIDEFTDKARATADSAGLTQLIHDRLVAGTPLAEIAQEVRDPLHAVMDYPNPMQFVARVRRSLGIPLPAPSTSVPAEFTGTLHSLHTSENPDLKAFEPQFAGDRYDSDGGTFGADGVYLDNTGRWTGGHYDRFPVNHIYETTARFQKAFVLTPESAPKLAAMIPDKTAEAQHAEDLFQKGQNEWRDIQKRMKDAGASEDEIEAERQELNARTQPAEQEAWSKIWSGTGLVDFLKSKGYDGIIVHGFGADAEEAYPELQELFSAKGYRGADYLFQDQVFSFNPENVTVGGRKATRPSSPEAEAAVQGSRDKIEAILSRMNEIRAKDEAEGRDVWNHSPEFYDAQKELDAAKEEHWTHVSRWSAERLPIEDWLQGVRMGMEPAETAPPGDRTTPLPADPDAAASEALIRSGSPEPAPEGIPMPAPLEGEILEPRLQGISTHYLNADDLTIEGTASEQTPAGDQTLLPGMKLVTDKEKADLAAGKPLQGGNAALPEDGLFGGPLPPDMPGLLGDEKSKPEPDAEAAAGARSEAPPEDEAPGADYGADNTFVKKDRYEELLRRLKQKLKDAASTMSAGFDPELMQIGAEAAAYHLEAGARTFAKFVKAIARDLESKVSDLRPYLRSWYNGARDMMEDHGLDVSGMDRPDKVDAELARLLVEEKAQTSAPVKTAAPPPAAAGSEQFRVYQQHLEQRWPHAEADTAMIRGDARLTEAERDRLLTMTAADVQAAFRRGMLEGGARMNGARYSVSQVKEEGGRPGEGWVATYEKGANVARYLGDAKTVYPTREAAVEAAVATAFPATPKPAEILTGSLPAEGAPPAPGAPSLEDAQAAWAHANDLIAQGVTKPLRDSGIQRHDGRTSFKEGFEAAVTGRKEPRYGSAPKGFDAGKTFLETPEGKEAAAAWARAAETDRAYEAGKPKQGSRTNILNDIEHLEDDEQAAAENPNGSPLAQDQKPAGVGGGAQEVLAGEQPGGAGGTRPVRRPRPISAGDQEPGGGEDQGRPASEAPAPADAGPPVLEADGGVTKPPSGTRGNRPPRTDSPATQGRADAIRAIEERSKKNYRITPDDRIGEGTPGDKIATNIEAIRTLKTIEDEAREATAEEKAKLVRYVGWGAFAQDVFSPYKQTYLGHRKALQALLTLEEFESARASTLNAHYTSPEVIKGLWAAARWIGFDGGLAIEPAAGVGHFIGMIPDDVAGRTAWTAVELDSITGRILKKLYAGTEVNVHGYETLKRPSNYYDLAISNVPFGNYDVEEKPYGKHSIHDFYFVKSLDKVRPGGLVAFITSRYTMDKADPYVRKMLAKQGDLVGAIRLPNSAFAGNAGTKVTTDVIFLRKKVPGEAESVWPNWLDTREIEVANGLPIRVNEYFADRPNMMIGKMTHGAGTMPGEAGLLAQDATPIADAIAARIKDLPQNALAPRAAPPPPQVTGTEIHGVKDGSYFVKDGVVYRRMAGVGEPQTFNKEEADKVTRLIGLRDLFNDLLASQIERDGRADEIRGRMQKSYGEFVKKYGPINRTVTTATKRLNKKGQPVEIVRQPNFDSFYDDPDSFKVASIERYDSETDTATPADIQTKDVIAEPTVRLIESPSDALAACLNELGRVDLQRIGQMLDLATEEDAAHALGDLAYRNPDGRQWESAEEYLSGNVVQKLEDARAIAKSDHAYGRNVRALEAIQPKRKTASQITPSIGAPWVPTDVYEGFLREIGIHRAVVTREPLTGTWTIESTGTSPNAQTRFGTAGTGGSRSVKAKDVVDAAFNNTAITVWYPKDPDGKSQINHADTDQARLKVQQLRDLFSGDRDTGVTAWPFKDPARAVRLEEIYNREMNNLVDRRYDGSHQTFPGLSGTKPPRQHQKDGAWRIVQAGNTLLAHDVGSGKTLLMAMSAMEQKRLGLVNKPAIIVPNHMLEQAAREFLEAYPNAKLLVAQKDEMSRDQRKAFIAKCAANDWDVVVFTHAAFGRLNVSMERRQAYIREQLSDLERVIEAASKGEGKRSPKVKDLEKAKKRLISKLDKLLASASKDDGVSFEQSGIDFLYVDEAHLFKNLSFFTRMQRVKGLSFQPSQRAEDLLLKTRFLGEKRPTRYAVFATATPLSNTLGEIFNMQRYLQPQVLDAIGTDLFDAWAATFARVIKTMGYGADGRSMQEMDALSKFKNVDALMGMWNQIADTKTSDMLRLPRPNVAQPGGVKYMPGNAGVMVEKPGVTIVESELSDAEEAFIQGLTTVLASVKGQKVQKGRPNAASVYTAGKKVATDGRLVGNTITDREAMGGAPPLEFNPGGKIAKLVENVVREYVEGKYPALAQLIFLDLGTPQTGKPRGAGKKAKGGPEVVETDPEDAEEAEADGEEGVDVALNEPEESRFNLYQDIKERLMKRNIPEKQIAFIHDADTDGKKARMFASVRRGEIRVLMGSRSMMGVGTNVQDLICAMHQVDIPPRPSDLQQSDGRGIRQGNKNPFIRNYRYVTKRSFDAIGWSMLDRKAKAINQFLSSARGFDELDDIDDPLPEATQMIAAASGDPRILEHAELTRQVQALQVQQRVFEETRYVAGWQLKQVLSKAEDLRHAIARADEDAPKVVDTAGKAFKATILGKDYAERKDAGAAMLAALLRIDLRELYSPRVMTLGTLSGFEVRMRIRRGQLGDGEAYLNGVPSLQGAHEWGASSDLLLNKETDPAGLVRRFENILRSIKEAPGENRANLAAHEAEAVKLQETASGTWPKADELTAKRAALTNLETAMKATAKPEAVKKAPPAEAWLQDHGYNVVQRSHHVFVVEDADGDIRASGDTRQGAVHAALEEASLQLAADGYDVEEDYNDAGKQTGWVVYPPGAAIGFEGRTKGEAIAKAIEAKAARDERAAAAGKAPLLLPPPRPAEPSLAQNPYAGLVPDADGNLVPRDKIVGGVSHETVLAKLIDECED